jgi:hypothetical protein
MAQVAAARRLAALAAPLKPEQAPFYMRPPVPPGLETTYPAPGWYWRPHGHPVAVYLGYSFELAAHTLRRLIEEEEAA